jgi:transcriptional regulator
MALSDEKREQVKALLATGAAKNDVAKKCKISWATVDAISKEAPDEIENIREQKRTAFIDRLWNSMDQALGLADKKIKLAVEASDLLDKVGEADISEQTRDELKEAVSTINNIPLGQISTFIGTIYDKHALMTGGKTADIGLSYEEQLKKVLGGAS